MDPFSANLIASAMIPVLLFLLFAIRGWLFRRAIFQVIAIFRDKHSRCTEWPKTPDQLGLVPPGFFDRFGKTKDYKPYALRALIRVGAVLVDEDGRLCLVEEKLAEEFR